MDNLNNNKTKYFPQKPWELREGKGYKPSAEAEGILSRLANSETNKITLKVLYALIAVLGISYAKDVFGDNFMEKLVATDGDGNITPVVNENEVMTVGNPIFVGGTSSEWGLMGTFDKNEYMATAYYNNKVSIRDNKTFNEIDSINAESPEQPVVDLENGTRAFVKWDTVKQERQIYIILKDGTEQTFNPNSKDIYALQFSNSKLYSAMKDKTNLKYYIEILAPNGEKQYAEDGQNKIELIGKTDFLDIHNGKIVVVIYNKVYIYNQDTTQLEHVSNELGTGWIAFMKARPEKNEVFMLAGDPTSIVSLDLTSYEIKPIIAWGEINTFVGDDYGVGGTTFSLDGNRLYLATSSWQDKSAHYLITLSLNPDGTVSKMEKSILTEGSPAPTPIDLAMDVDTDKKGNVSKPDGFTNSMDNCPDVYNPSQLDKNNNGIGDACENAGDYAASVGYDSYQEPAGTGHNVFSNGNVDIVDMGDKVVVSPVQGEKSEIEIINNGNEQTKGISVNIPPNTDYEWVSLEGFGDDEKTEGIDFPEGKTIDGSTEENGVLVGISGTDIKLKCTPKIVQPEQTESQVDEFTGADDVSIPDQITPDETTPDTAEITPDVIDAQDTYEVTPDIAEITLDTSDTIQPDQFDAYEGTDNNKPDAQTDTAQIDTATTDTSPQQDTTPQIESEKPKNGGGGCDMNNGPQENAGTFAFTGAALLALAAMRKRIAKALKG